MKKNLIKRKLELKQKEHKNLELKTKLQTILRNYISMETIAIILILKAIIKHKFHQILVEIPELAHIFPELEHELNLDKNSKPRLAKKILEESNEKKRFILIF